MSCKYSHTLNRYVVSKPTIYGPRDLWVGTQKFPWTGPKPIWYPVGWGG